MPRIVFLNGASSAGKTSIGRALQDLAGEPYLLLGLDTCFAMVPPAWGGGRGGPLSRDGFAYQDRPADDGHPMLAITYGAVGQRMLAGFRRAVIELVRVGNPVIIDEMLLDDRARDDWLDLLAPWQPLLVGVFCDDAELVRREQARGNRPGLARWSARHAHTGLTYHVTVDTTHGDPTQHAAQLIAAMTAVGPRP